MSHTASPLTTTLPTPVPTTTSQTLVPDNVLFASNDVAVAVDAYVHGSINIPGNPSPAKVILMAFDTTIKLYIFPGDTLPSPVATFDVARGFRGDLFPDQKSWVVNGNSQFQTPLYDTFKDTIDISADIRLIFNTDASFWAFAYYVNGISGPLPRTSNSDNAYGLGSGIDLYQALFSQEVFNFPVSGLGGKLLRGEAVGFTSIPNRD